MKENIKEKINNLIKENEVCLFMKGTPEVPQCGFSLAVSNVLKHLEVKFSGVNVLDDPEIREKLLDIIPLRKFTTARHVGLLALYLASPASDWMTGQDIYFDGGETAMVD